VPAARIDVTVPDRRGSGRRLNRPGIAVHRPRRLEDEDRAVGWAIPLTGPSRTLLDLAAVLGPSALRRALDAADRLELLDTRRLGRLCEVPGRRGTRRLRALLAQHRPLPETRSELERRFLRLCDDAGLPRPAVNVAVAGFEVDFHWPAARLVAELDGYAHHRGRAGFESDRRRDAAITAVGNRVVRFTNRRLTDEAQAVVTELRAMLGATGAGAVGAG
jgi:very-short-patch-repair endonuclease